MAEQCGAQHTEADGKYHKDRWLHRCGRTSGHEKLAAPDHCCRCGFTWEISKPITYGCRLRPYHSQMVTDRCECGHIVLQHSDQGEVLEGFGYCSICAIRVAIEKGLTPVTTLHA